MPSCRRESDRAARGEFVATPFPEARSAPRRLLREGVEPIRFGNGIGRFRHGLSHLMWLVCVCLSSFAPAFGQSVPSPPSVRDFGLRSGTWATLELPVALDQAAKVLLPPANRFSAVGVSPPGVFDPSSAAANGDDQEFLTLATVPHSIRSANFRLRTALGSEERAQTAPPVTTFRGRILERKGTVAAGAFLSDGLWARVLFPSGRSLYIQPARDPSAPDLHLLYYTHEILPSNAKCGVGFTPSTHQPFGPGGCGGELCIAEIACDADVEYFEAYGSRVDEVLARIELILNTVNLQYEREVAISHRLTDLVVRVAEPDPYTTLNSNALLNQFKDEWNNNQTGVPRDLAHLFTGRDILGLTVGEAFVGVVCSPTEGYAYSQSDYQGNLALVIDLTAHELGHNWSADHCNCLSPPFTMNSAITGANRFQPADTRPEIEQHRDSRLCLSGGISHDSCEDARDVCNGLFVNDTTHASQAGTTSCDSSATLDVWYRYRAGADGVVQIDTTGSAIDTVLSVYAGCEPTQEIACDDDSAGGTASLLTLAVITDEVLLIRVAGSGGTGGPIQLNIQGIPCAPPSNDDCVDALLICPGSYVGTTGNALNGPQTSCGGSTVNRAAWFEYVPRFSGLLVLDTCGSDFDTVLSLHSDCGPGTEIDCSSSSPNCAQGARIEAMVLAEVRYWIRVSGFGTQAGSFDLHLSGPECNNDDCFWATPVTAGTWSTTLQGASRNGVASCGLAENSPDSFFEFTAPVAGTLVVTTCGTNDLPGLDSGVDSVLSLHTDCPATLTNEITCNDDSIQTVSGVDCSGEDLGLARDSLVITPVSQGQLVLIRLSRFQGTAPGEVLLNVSLIPDNDDCGNAEPVEVGLTSGSLAGATNDGNASCGGAQLTADVWYRFVPTCSGELFVATCGSHDAPGTDQGTDTVVSLHSDSCPGNIFNQFTCQDDWTPATFPTGCFAADSGMLADSITRTSVQAGVPVLIRVSHEGTTAPGAFVLQIQVEPSNQNLARAHNLDFDLGPSGWCFRDESYDGAADFSMGSARITGGDDGISGVTLTYIEQAFTTSAATHQHIRFDWSFATSAPSGSDEAFWDVIDLATGDSVVGGPQGLGNLSGASGTLSADFAGSGDYSLRLGTRSFDNTQGPGTSMFDDIAIGCATNGGSLANGRFDDPTGAPWCFLDSSTNGSVSFANSTGKVTGGSDSSGQLTRTQIQQTFVVGPAQHTLRFDWSFSSMDTTGTDLIFFDLRSVATNASVIGGTMFPSSGPGTAGMEFLTVNGPGEFILELGVQTADNAGAPGVAEFDNVILVSQSCIAVVNLGCTASGSSVLLDWSPVDTYDSLDVLRNGTVIATLPGSAVTFTDAGVVPGMYSYVLRSNCGTLASASPPCVVDVTVPAPEFVRADFNGDGVVQLGDGVALLGYLFAAGQPPSCEDTADVNDDGNLDLVDPTLLLAHLFIPLSPRPSSPFPSCGPDPTPGDPFGCTSHAACP